MEGCQRSAESCEADLRLPPLQLTDPASFDRLEKELAPGRRWSGFDRAIGTGAFFADRPSASARAAELGELEDPPAREAA